MCACWSDRVVVLLRVKAVDTESLAYYDCAHAHPIVKNKMLVYCFTLIRGDGTDVRL